MTKIEEILVFCLHRTTGFIMIELTYKTTDRSEKETTEPVVYE